MSFKYFRPTVRKVNTTQKAPAFKNTASAKSFADQIDTADILTNNSVEKHLADINFDDHGHSILKESGLTSGHSILDSSGTTKIASLESFLGHKGEQSENQFGADGLSAAGGFGRGMAANTDAAECVAVTEAIIRGLEQQCEENPDLCDEQSRVQVLELNNECADQRRKENEKILDKYYGSYPKDNTGRPLDDVHSGNNSGGFMTWKLQDQLSHGLKNAKDPITNPNGDDLGSNYLTDADLIQMEADLRNAKDPATNWGDDTYNNFMGTVEMNVGEVSLKAPATNWGDNDTSNSDNVVDTLFTVQNDF
jgi:hypothetical protein